MVKAQKGRAGCGCLLFVLIVCMVLAGVLIHPFSLRVLAGRFQYADRAVPCDAIFVPRFMEDRNGEVYTEAFREYWAGNGKALWVEDDHVFGFTMKDIVGRMAKERGIREGTVHALEVEGDGAAKAALVRRAFAKQGFKRVLLVVPDYASRRYHLLYGPTGSGDAVLFLVKPVDVSYFKVDKWWRTDLSRAMMGRELYRICLLYVDRFKYGRKGEDGKE